MVNLCSICNNQVAGHKARFGCMPGPGNCTVTPIPPSSLSSAGGRSSSESGSIMATTSPATTSTTVSLSVNQTPSSGELNPTSSAPLVTSAAAPTSSESGAAGTSQGHILSNAQLEQSLTSECDHLESYLHKLEEEKIKNNIFGLHEQKTALLQRIKQVEQELASAQAPQPRFQVPPSTTTTWSAPNPFVPPSTSSGISASAFGSAALGNTTRSASLASVLQSQAAGSSSSGIAPSSASFTHASGIPPNLASQSQAASMPNLHTTAFPPPMAPTARGPLFATQSVPNIAEAAATTSNMAALNPNEFPFVSSDQIFESNPLVKAILGMQGDTREEAARLGKYIPELFALKHGPIQEIRSRMSYSEFVAMYTRMLMYMLRDDPHLVPDRLVFLYNVAKKAAKFRWPDVRDCYGVAIQEIKINRRKWADHWGEITEDLERAQPSNPRYGPPRPAASSRAAGVRLVSPLDASRPLCADFNDRSCTRQFCKFHHECAKCGGGHARQNCFATGDKEPRSYHSSHSSHPPQST